MQGSLVKKILTPICAVGSIHYEFVLERRAAKGKCYK
jgi:hypothetical protein